MDFRDRWYAEYLACPDCRQPLKVEEEIRCGACQYHSDVTSVVDLKPHKPHPVSMVLPRIMPVDPVTAIESIKTVSPDITYDGPSAKRDSSTLMSVLSEYLDSGGNVLDLGCGCRDQADPVTFLGHQYVGIDYANRASDFLADAHAIPFLDDVFDCVFSYAVLEHLHNPYIALREIERVLKPGGIYVGTVSQGEPFHASFFHHTYWGILSLASTVPAFQVDRLWSSGDTLFSLSRMGGYPRIVKQLIKGVAMVHQRFPVLAPRKMKWPRKKRQVDDLGRAGSLCFVLRKLE
jgi:SAM-dependent methyltransferase